VSDHPLPRRTVLKGAAAAGAAGVALPWLAGCGSSSGGGAPATVSVKTAEVPVGGGVVEQSSNVLVVQPTQGTYKAFSAICPHQGCTVGTPQDGVVTCPCHGSTFKAADGSLVTGPATQGLTPLTSHVQDGEVVVST